MADATKRKWAELLDPMQIVIPAAVMHDRWQWGTPTCVMAGLGLATHDFSGARALET
jgi:hypothetical protein